jgi:hypothetical protein
MTAQAFSCDAVRTPHYGGVLQYVDQYAGGVAR